MMLDEIVTEPHFAVVRDLIATLNLCGQEIALARICAFLVLERRSECPLRWGFRKPRHNGVTSEISTASRKRLLPGFVSFNTLFGGVSANSTCLQLTQSMIPAPRKPFQVPSGIFLCTPSTLPRTCTGAPPGDVINETVNGRHSTSQPPSRKIISLYSGT